MNHNFKNKYEAKCCEKSSMNKGLINYKKIIDSFINLLRSKIFEL